MISFQSIDLFIKGILLPNIFYRKMDFCHIPGYHGGQLLYLKDEKHLFLRKESKNGKTYWVCYDTIKSANGGKSGPCRARCIMDDSTKTCERNKTPHTSHENHEINFNDLQSLNSMKDHCRYLARNFPYSAHKIPIKDIFLAEMVK